MKKQLWLSVVLVLSAPALAANYEVRCSGPGEIQGTEVRVNSSVDSEGRQVLVKSLFNQHGAPVGPAEEFLVREVTETGTSVGFSFVTTRYFLGGADYHGTLSVANGGGAGRMHLSFSQFDESTGLRKHWERDYQLNCQLDSRE